MKILKLILLVSFICVSIFLNAQNDSLLHKENILNKRTKIVLLSEASIYSASLIGLNNLWYKDYAHSSFHFFDDSNEWLQMDKVGHFYSTYYVSQFCSDAFKWSGINKNKSALFGAGIGFLYVSSIEIFDGFSTGWGASVSDLSANAFGSIMYAGQEVLFNEQKVIMKFSYHTSPYSKYRPDVLGSSFSEKLLKDYNGQTYWLSANIKSITKLDMVPKWLNIAFGYGADGLIGGDNNPNEINNVQLPYFKRVRQYYLSFDIDFKRIKTKNKALRLLFNLVNYVKIPFPAIELYDKKIYFNALYF